MWALWLLVLRRQGATGAKRSVLGHVQGVVLFVCIVFCFTHRCCATVQVLVVSEVDRVHPVLYPLLRRELHKQAGRLVSAFEADGRRNDTDLLFV